MPSGVYVRTPEYYEALHAGIETRDQSGEKNGFYGKTHTPETKEIMKTKATGRVGYWKGKHLPEETKLKLRVAQKEALKDPEYIKKLRDAKLGKPLSEAHKQKISIAHKGVPKSDEWKQKIAEALTGLSKSEEHRMNMSLANRGEKSTFYRHGRHKDPYSHEFTSIVREYALERFDHKCAIPGCGMTIEEYLILHPKARYKVLPVHHIDYNKENSRPDNLIPLCPTHHAKSGFDREYYKLVCERLVYFKLQEENEGEGSILIPS